MGPPPPPPSGRTPKAAAPIKKEEIDTDHLATICDVALQQVPLERRVVAAIVGMPEE